MSAIGFLVLLVIAIVVLMLLMTKVKLNPVMSLFVVALAFGVILGVFGTEGYSFMDTSHAQSLSHSQAAPKPYNSQTGQSSLLPQLY